MSRGRSPEERASIARAVFAGMRQGKSAHAACVDVGVPPSTFGTWVDADAELAEEYTRAREDLVEYIAAETLALADAPVGSTDSGSTDTGAVQKQRLQVDTRKWLLSKLAPRKYGDRVQLAGDADAPLTVQVVRLTDER